MRRNAHEMQTSSVSVMLLVTILLISSFPSCSEARNVTISNDELRLDVDGNVVNAHDGGIYLFDGVYHLYGTVYEHCSQAGPTCDFVCGYYNNTFSLYTSLDLVNWTLITKNVLPAMSIDNSHNSYWMANVGYNNKTKMYMMVYWDGKYGFHTNQIAMASSNSSLGPFVPIKPIALKGPGVISSTVALFIDSTNQAWARYNTIVSPRSHGVELLNDDWTDTTGKFSTILVKDDYPWLEGGGMFERDGVYYVMLGSDCCFCQWGASALVFTASDPLGNWTKQQDVNHCADGHVFANSTGGQTINPCSLTNPYAMNFTVPSQQFNVVTVNSANGPVFLYYGELFRSSADGWKDHDRQAWIPLEFDKTGRVQVMQFYPEFVIDLPNS